MQAEQKHICAFRTTSEPREKVCASVFHPHPNLLVSVDPGVVVVVL